MYQTLDTSMGEPGLPYSVKRRAIDAVSLRERASEEQEMVKAEMERVMQHLLDQHHITDHEIRRCMENYNTAGQAVLTQHIVRIEQRLERFFHHFKQHIPTLPEPPSSHIEQRSHSHESDSSTSPFDNVSDEEEGDSTDEEEGEFIEDEGGYSTDDTYPSDMEIEAWGAGFYGASGSFDSTTGKSLKTLNARKATEKLGHLFNYKPKHSMAKPAANPS
ncbi:PREDICTED: uncharacterized protein LOC109475338, partial [Branchiostoma belcheri]|uniref:Uncharacterized protein LOC109475338 n=1 Tax=Branchiostoma belcheri TaxID=7741 RepID=A0A6P4ZKA4_BRABE